MDERGTLVGEERWLDADQQWPRHPKPYWRGLLKEARQAGWFLTMYSDHAWGRMVCDREVRNPCTVRINSTAANGEFFVLHVATNVVRRCKHRTAPAANVAARLLDRAERLLDIVEECLDAEGDRRRAADLLDAAARGLAEADALFDSAVALDDEARSRETAARERFADEGLPANSPLEDVVEDAAQGVREARRQLPQRIPAAIRRRIDELRARAVALQSRIE